MSIVLRNYPDQHYKIIFNQNTGFFARVEDKEFDEPFWSEKGPELLDISITNWCDNNCQFCYKESNNHGKHMSLTDYKSIIIQARDSNVLQVALGGGNPNQHPDFIEILKFTRENDIIPSYTTNGKGLTEEVLEATKQYCGAVAISAYQPYELLFNGLNEFNRIGVKPNIHFMLDKGTISTAIKWLENGSIYLDMCNALIFLNYKPIGRTVDHTNLLKFSDKLEQFFHLVHKHNKCNIGFDSCSVSGILTYMKDINLNLVESCDAGRFSAYISEDMRMYPCSFMTKDSVGDDLNNKSILEVWHKSEQFKHVRFKLKAKPKYKHESNVGCPILPEIDFA